MLDLTYYITGLWRNTKVYKVDELYSWLSGLDRRHRACVVTGSSPVIHALLFISTVYLVLYQLAFLFSLLVPAHANGLCRQVENKKTRHLKIKGFTIIVPSKNKSQGSKAVESRFYALNVGCLVKLVHASISNSSKWRPRN